MSFTSLSSQRELERDKSFSERLARYKREGINVYLSGIIDRNPSVEAAFGNAKIYAFLGDNEKALDNLEFAVKGHAFPVVFAKADPVFDSLHDDTRYKRILRQMNLE